MEHQHAAFVQADKMRQRAEQNLASTAADRNRLHQITSDLLQDQTLNSCGPAAPHGTTADHSCSQSMLHLAAEESAQTGPDTPVAKAVHGQSSRHKKEINLSEQTNDKGSQIAAVHARDSQLQELQHEVEAKQELIRQQAVQLKDAAVKRRVQQGVVQQMQSRLKTTELAALLFNVPLLFTKVSSSFPAGPRTGHMPLCLLPNYMHQQHSITSSFLQACIRIMCSRWSASSLSEDWMQLLTHA